VKNRSPQPQRTLVSLPQTPFFHLAVPEGAMPVNAGVDSISVELPPNSVTKMLLHLSVPAQEHDAYTNLCGARCRVCRQR
jgi:hypothetical protein